MQLLLMLLIIIILLISATFSINQVCNNNEFIYMDITYPHHNDTIIGGITKIEITYEIKDLKVFNNYENQLMLCLTNRKHNSNDMKSICGLNLMRTHELSLYYNGYQDIIISICIKNDYNECLCSTSITVYNEYKPSCIINTKLNTIHDIIRVFTMEDKEEYYTSYSIIETQTKFEIFIPVSNINLSNSEMKPILSLVDSIEDILSLKEIKITVHFLLNTNSEKTEIDKFCEWAFHLMNNKMKVITNIYICQNDANCIFWTIYDKMNLFDFDSIILVLDSKLKMHKTYIQSIYNLFYNTYPCYALPLWRKNIPTSLFYFDTDIKHQIYRWAFANISQSFNNSTNDIDTSIAFRLKTFIYFIKEQNFTSDMTIYDHLMYAYDSNNRISIVHN